METDERRLLTAMLRCGAGEDAPDLADRRTIRPQPAGLIEEVSYLSGHVAEARRSAEDDRVGFRQLRPFCDRAGDSRAAPFQYLVGDEFGTCHRLTSLAPASRAPAATASAHLIDMPIHAVKDDLNFR
jgi:hypothetical protein